MDWEPNERYRATLLLAFLMLSSVLLMVLQETRSVRGIKSFLVHASRPVHNLFSDAMPAGSLDRLSSAGTSDLTGVQESAELYTGVGAQALKAENARLRKLLDLRGRHWPRSVAAMVIGRDPHRWFQELVIDKGSDHGLQVDDPVVAVAEGALGLVGRIVDVQAQVGRVMLLSDSLSAVAATAAGQELEDGVVEGTPSHELILRYLNRDSRVQIGDEVVTSGLGQRFPAVIPIGRVIDRELDERQLFIEAKLRPSIHGKSLQAVLVLVTPKKEAP